MKTKTEIHQHRDRLRDEWHRTRKLFTESAKEPKGSPFRFRQIANHNMELTLLESQIEILDWILQDFDMVDFWKRDPKYYE